jgi:hypothetical protein
MPVQKPGQLAFTEAGTSKASRVLRRIVQVTVKIADPKMELLVVLDQPDCVAVGTGRLASRNHNLLSSTVSKNKSGIGLLRLMLKSSTFLSTKVGVPVASWAFT